MTIDTARLRALAEAATPGPWEADDNQPFSRELQGIFAPEQRRYVLKADFDDQPKNPNDAEYIAAADPQTVLALLDEIERLRGEGEWEHGYSLLNKDGEPTGLIIPANAREWAREGEAYVRRRAAGPWERVEGENDD